MQISPGQLALSYSHRADHRVSLSTEFAFQMGQNGWESIWALGCQYGLATSLFKGRIDSTGKVSGFVEEMMSANSKFILSGELDHIKKQYRFGVGFALYA